MTRELVHKSAASNLLRQPYPTNLSKLHGPRSSKLRVTFFSPCRTLAQVQSHHILPEVWFNSTNPHRYLPRTGVRPEAPPDERTLKLGKTLRILQARLPSLLASPLPNDILSPHITLHLFPSTHPHLPSVSGRVAYHAALWTAPVTWGRVPFFDVKLIILNERMIKNGTPLLHTSSSSSSDERGEKLVVRWKTEGKTKGKGVGALYRGIGAREQVDKITEWLGGGTKDDGEFTGLFIFEFDAEGRIATHTIEHAQEGGNWDKASRVVTVTDWLLGKARRRRKEEVPAGGLAWECEGHEGLRWGRRADAQRR